MKNIIHIIIAEIIPTALIVILLFGVIFNISVVNGDSMYPTYKSGDVVLVNSLFYKNPKKNDIITFKLNNKYYIKRVIGVAGDTVDIDYADGKIIINGEEQNEDYIYEPIKKKAEKIFNQRYDIESHNFNFLKKTCCDFKKLEKALDQFEIRQEEK